MSINPVGAVSSAVPDVRDLLVAEVSRRGMAELVQFQTIAGGGVLLEQDPCPVITGARPAGVRADGLRRRGRRAGTGLRLALTGAPNGGTG